MQFQVPQFIEVEDKIFGPLTFKQFVYVGGALGTSYLFWRLLPFFISVPLIIAIVGMGVALAFMQVNGRPFITGVESAFYYFFKGKLYLWNNARKTQNATIMKTVAPQTSAAYVPKLSDSRLHDLAWSLDINERIAAGTTTQDERPRVRPDTLAPMRTARSALVK
ncbi:MAG: hypothetical protein RLZZ342_641 [Candidatus Parcubacteria bacterium]